jgi:hypothetical protein
MSAAKKICAVLVLGWLMQGVWAAPVPIGSGDWEGSRSSAPGGGITAFSAWADGGVNFSWLITEQSGLFTYEYVISGPNGRDLGLGLEEWILELDPGADWTGVFPDDLAVVDLHEVAGSDGLPLEGGSLFGVQFSFDPGVLSFAIVFATTHAPIWGDFYMRDGSGSQGGLVVAYNEHFGQDPQDFSGFTGFIPTPGLAAIAVPEPGTLTLLGLAFALLTSGLGRRSVDSRP